MVRKVSMIYVMLFSISVSSAQLNQRKSSLAQKDMGSHTASKIKNSLKIICHCSWFLYISGLKKHKEASAPDPKQMSQMQEQIIKSKSNHPIQKTPISMQPHPVNPKPLHVTEKGIS